ncbi:hypothetical protein GCK32_004599, partial [Trichostrongylus colubriformis]
DSEDYNFSEAWLKAAELTPTWVWALVDLPETMHAHYQKNARFVHLIQQVRDFLHLLIKVHKCDGEMIKTLAFRLGARHKIRRIFRVRVHADRSEEEELINAWRQLMNTIVEAMKRGYEGCASQKTPMRLSITNSIISMASLRSGRSRSASHFLEPNLSPVIACPATPVQSSPALNGRSRSIFRTRQQRLSQDYTNARRLSSPNRPTNGHSNSDLLRTDGSSGAREQRRSLTIIPFP